MKAKGEKLDPVFEATVRRMLATPPQPKKPGKKRRAVKPASPKGKR